MTLSCESYLSESVNSVIVIYSSTPERAFLAYNLKKILICFNPHTRDHVFLVSYVFKGNNTFKISHQSFPTF